MPSYASMHSVVETLVKQLVVQTWWNYVEYDDTRRLVTGEEALEILRDGQPSHLKNAGLPVLLLEPIAATYALIFAASDDEAESDRIKGIVANHGSAPLSEQDAAALEGVVIQALGHRLGELRPACVVMASGTYRLPVVQLVLADMA